MRQKKTVLAHFRNWFGHDPAWRTEPVVTEKHPPGAPFIIVNEIMERFSYYGMRAVLVIVVTTLLPFDQLMTEAEANALFHGFVMWNYALPILGAILADAFLGKYRTVMYLSIVYSAGCFVLAFDQSVGSIQLGLMLIAVGSGGIKPCVVSCLGDQYGKLNQHLVNPTITKFYRGINLGAFLSIILTPLLLKWFGPKVAFGVPAVGMLLATFTFWTGRNKYNHTLPRGFSTVVSEMRVGLKPLLKLIILYSFMAAFFCVSDQSGSEWVIQAGKMNLNFLGFEWLPAQIQMLNPLIIICFSEQLEEKLYPFIKRVIHDSDLVVIAVGLVFTCASFVLVTFVEMNIEGDVLLSIGWQLLAYVLLTIGEVLVYLSGMQLSYRKAMPSMKAFVQAIFLLSVAAGNFFTMGVNSVIQQDPPSFKPDVPGTYVLSLTASDGKVETTSEFPFSVLSDADYEVYAAKEKKDQLEDQLDLKKLTASAGKNRVVLPGRIDVPLYGKANAKASTETYYYAWTIKGLPEGSKMTLTDMSGLDRRLASFTPDDVPGLYTFGFEARVGDRKVTDEVVINVTDENVAPVVLANIATTEIGDMAILDGGATYDPNNGDELTYHWDVVKVPEGSTITSDNIQNRTLAAEGSRLKGSEYYLFFTIMIILVTILFVPFARKADLGPDYVQPNKDGAEAGA